MSAHDELDSPFGTAPQDPDPAAGDGLDSPFGRQPTGELEQTLGPEEDRTLEWAPGSTAPDAAEGTIQ